MSPERNNSRILIAGGGTGGHVLPALAIGRELRDHHGAQVHFVGTSRGMETRLVPAADFPLTLIHVGQLKNVSLATRARTLADLPRGTLACFRLLRDFRPDVVIGVGGYASGPAMIAAIMRGIPTMAFEPNAYPGLANRLVGRYVRAAAVNFAETLGYFRNAHLTGIPVRKEFFALPQRPPQAAPHLLVFGGSQGARILNRALPAIAVQLLNQVPGLTILHQAGAANVEETRADYEKSGADPARWQVHAFLDDMPARFAEASLVLARSGASTVAELAAARKPSLLIPFALAADDHQRRNAEALASTGAAQMLLERDVSPDRLLSELVTLLRDQEALTAMSRQAAEFARPNAVNEIAELALSLTHIR